jgi:hypothetical protein
MHICGAQCFLYLGFQVGFLHINGNGLPNNNNSSDNTLLDPETINDLTYFFFKKNSFPSNFGKRGMTRSSAKNMPYAAQSFLFASNGLYLSRNFEMPITLIAAKC